MKVMKPTFHGTTRAKSISLTMDVLDIQSYGIHPLGSTKNNTYNELFHPHSSFWTPFLKQLYKLKCDSGLWVSLNRTAIAIWYIHRSETAGYVKHCQLFVAAKNPQEMFVVREVSMWSEKLKIDI